MSCEKLEADKPGEEGFYARCLLLQKTSEHEVYVYDSLHLGLIASKSLLSV